jgi:DNA-directed RNA polymerase subunit RPC12/RpoP
VTLLSRSSGQVCGAFHEVAFTQQYLEVKVSALAIWTAPDPGSAHFMKTPLRLRQIARRIVGIDRRLRDVYIVDECSQLSEYGCETCFTSYDIDMDEKQNLYTCTECSRLLWPSGRSSFNVMPDDCYVSGYQITVVYS